MTRLGSLGWLELVERAGRKTGLRLKEAPSADGLDETGRWLLSALRRWTAHPDEPPSWDGWREALRRQAAAEKAHAQSTLASLLRPSDAARAARDLARVFERFPDPEGELPSTRLEWDRALAYAAALGRAETFLRKAREVNEFYVRHFQGVVVTFCTPGWYREDAAGNEERFAYLTTGLAPVLSRWSWTEVEPA